VRKRQIKSSKISTVQNRQIKMQLQNSVLQWLLYIGQG